MLELSSTAGALIWFGSSVVAALLILWLHKLENGRISITRAEALLGLFVCMLFGPCAFVLAAFIVIHAVSSGLWSRLEFGFLSSCAHKAWKWFDQPLIPKKYKK